MNRHVKTVPPTTPHPIQLCEALIRYHAATCSVVIGDTPLGFSLRAFCRVALMFARYFIERPIFASVISIVLVICGAVAYFVLPTTQYPEITPPTIEVSTIYPGANAELVRDTIAAPIEQQVSGVENALSMSSLCTNDGRYRLVITFKPGTDLNMAQVLTQVRVTLAMPILPELVQREGVSVLTPSPNSEPVLVRESSSPMWGLKGFSDEEATQCRADCWLASAG